MTSVSITDEWGTPAPEQRVKALANCMAKICGDAKSFKLFLRALGPYGGLLASQNNPGLLADRWLGAPGERGYQLSVLGKVKQEYGKMVAFAEEVSVDDLHRARTVMKALESAIEIVWSNQ